MKQTKDRKIFYSRAQWHEDPENLFLWLETAHARLKRVSDRTFRIHDYEVKCVRCSPRSSMLLLDVTKTFPDTPTGLVKKPDQSETSEVAEQQPPEQWDYLTGQVFVLVAENHVLCLPNEGATEYTAYEYIRSVLGRLGRPDLAGSVSFEKVANLEKHELIQNEGAKSVRLNVSMFEAEHLHQERTRNSQSKKKFDVMSLPKALADQLMGYFRDDEDLESTRAKENLMIKLEVTWRKTKKGADKASSVVQDIAHRLADEQTDGFTITTNSGKRLTHDEIRLNKPVSVKRNGNSTQRADAFSKLIEYYGELREQCLIPSPSQE